MSPIPPPSEDSEVTSAEVQASVNAAINDVIDGAPGALDTLNELAAAVGDDPAFSATIAAAVAAAQGDAATAQSDATQALSDAATAQSAADAAQQSIDDHESDPTGAHEASSIGFDNTSSGFSATDLQGAVDEIASDFATQSFVAQEVSDLVDSAPATLDTLNELAAALGDDPNFATTTASLIGTAQSTANTAVSNASAAQSTANTAVSNAAAAQSTANTAVANAATAQSTINTHISNPTGAHAGTAVSINPSGLIVVSGTTVQSAVSQLDAGVAARLALAGGTMAGNIAMGGNKVTGLGAATTNGDAVRYEQSVRTADNQSVGGDKTFTGTSTFSVAPRFAVQTFSGTSGNISATGGRLVLKTGANNTSLVIPAAVVGMEFEVVNTQLGFSPIRQCFVARSGSDTFTYGVTSGITSQFQVPPGASCIFRCNSTGSWDVRFTSSVTRVGSFTPSAGTGLKQVSGLGFRPRSVDFTYLPAASTANALLAGGSVEENGSQFAWSDCTSALGGSRNSSINRCLLVITSPTSSAVYSQASMSSFDNDGFTLNFDVHTGPLEYGFVATA